MPAIIPILIGTSIVGTGVSAYGSIKAGNAAKKAGEAEASAILEQGRGAQESAESQGALADYNATVADLQAADAIKRGRLDANRQRTSTRLLIGSQRAAFAGSNVDVGFGSAVDVQGDAAYLGELDSLQIETNATLEAWGFKTQGEDLRRRAAIVRKEGVNAVRASELSAEAARAGGNAAKSASRLNATSTILSGASSLLSTKYGYGRGGA